MEIETEVAMIVLVTVPGMEEGERIAAILVGERLAACVNLLHPVRSVYRWQGKVQADDEVLLLIKTTAQRYAALERRVREVHPYEVPEVVGLRIERGSPPYLEWLRSETAE